MDIIQLKSNVSIKTEGNESVYYKVDGQRFGADCTLKLVVDTNYVFIFDFQPAVYVSSCSIMGSTVTAVETSRECNSVSYSVNWSTASVSATKRGQRDTLMITINIKDQGILTMKPQVKFYKSTDNQHYTWGKALTRIDYECHYKDGSSFIEIDKEIYR
ncbi:CB1 cannabinoid receptor-interacting protein 1-like [Centruroides vittatus]|uniref:CB1 cannabinoid receptor-interacting protein 1-like n=1 Tax=Centruroides vittatus TaxID=120091 RepID=UPI00350ECAAE